MSHIKLFIMLLYSTCSKSFLKTFYNVCIYEAFFNPIRSGGGAAALKAPPPSDFCPHEFYFGATLLCVRSFSQKLVQHHGSQNIKLTRFS